jgi:hypothetical protein
MQAGIVLSGLLIGSAQAEVSLSQLMLIPPVVETLSAKYTKISDSVTQLTTELGKLNTIIQDNSKNYGDKFVEMANFLNKLNPVLEIIIGSSTQDIQGHKEEGILLELNKILEALGKKQLPSETLIQLQNAVEELEEFSSFLTNTAQSFKIVKP